MCIRRYSRPSFVHFLSFTPDLLDKIHEQSTWQQLITAKPTVGGNAPGAGAKPTVGGNAPGAGAKPTVGGNAPGTGAKPTVGGNATGTGSAGAAKKDRTTQGNVFSL
jgi:hypothetical protein